jgi:hypothetical protein
MSAERAMGRGSEASAAALVMVMASAATIESPSYLDRQMSEGAANLVDHVLPAVPVRQLVLTIPSPLLAKLLGAATVATARSDRRARHRRHGPASLRPSPQAEVRPALSVAVAVEGCSPFTVREGRSMPPDARR